MNGTFHILEYTFSRSNIAVSEIILNKMSGLACRISRHILIIFSSDVRDFNPSESLTNKAGNLAKKVCSQTLSLFFSAYFELNSLGLVVSRNKKVTTHLHIMRCGII